MNASARMQPETPTPWFRVGEVWLVLMLLGASVIGTFGLLAAALAHPDVHLVVPNAVHQPSSMPPMAPTTPARTEASP
jgi:hypothetical protein